MAKYRLDDKGILTIVSTREGGIYAVNRLLKRLTVLLFVISILVSVGTYVVLYSDRHTTGTATGFLSSAFSGRDRSAQLSALAKRLDPFYGFEALRDKLADHLAYYSEVCKGFVERGRELVAELIDQLRQLRK